jgi:hypothetical protein
MVFRKVLRELWKNKRMVIAPGVLIKRLNMMKVLADPIANQNLEDTFVYLMETLVALLRGFIVVTGACCRLHEALQQQVKACFEPAVNLSPTR